MPRPAAPSSRDERPTQPDGAQPAGERIAKLLARAGVASRREIERMIADGRVARDGVALDTPATVLPSLAGVTVDGVPVAAAEAARLFLYHKPPGLLVTERDPRGRPTIYDRLPPDLPRLVPVGRLDLATEGLLLLTTDGELKRQLELPATGVERTYRARVYGPVSQAMLEGLIEGIEIDGFRYGPIDANLERRTGANSWIELTLAEGKNREVRRVLEYLGLEVSRLIRTRYGAFVLGDLAPGDVGEVRQADLVSFRQTLSKARPAFRDRRSGEAPPTIAPVLFRSGASRGPTAVRPARVPQRPATASQTPAASPQRLPSRPAQLDAGPRRGGGTVEGARDRAGTSRPVAPKHAASRHPASKPLASKPPTSQPSTFQHSTSRPLPAPASAGDAPVRPPKLQRKTGWAKPKPKAGPQRPRKR